MTTTYSAQKNPIENQVSDPTLIDVLDQLEENIFLNFNCHSIARIKTFDAATQTVQCEIVYTKSYLIKKPDGTYDTKEVTYPFLADCPVVSMYGGNAGLTMPIKEGDFCVVLFNDRDFDIWLKFGTVTEPNSSRKHSISDAIALIGIRNKVSALSNYDTDRAVLYNKNTKVTVNDGKIGATNGTQDLKTLIDTLITTIQAITVSSVAIDNSAAFTIIKSDFDDLLETP